MLVDQYGKPLVAAATKADTARARSIRAKYDAAGSDRFNSEHWAQADSLSAVRANNAAVRARLRDRSRYEVSNNSYACGGVNTIVNYTIGQNGPTLQLVYRGEDQSRVAELRQAAQRVEILWSNWAYARQLPQKLTDAAKAVIVDGESFGLMINNATPSVHTPIQLDVRMYECDQFADPHGGAYSLDDSGVRLDSNGEPEAYSMLKMHPGDGYQMFGEASWLPASQVLHCFRRDRPGQLRGIPRTTPALPLFAQLRRYSLATLTAAETAADFAAVLYEDVVNEDQAGTEPWSRIPIERGAMLTVPGGNRLAQLKPEQPVATFDEFTKSLLREIARAMGLPAALMLGDSSNFNYSSGRLDLQSFQRSMAVDRSQVLECEFLDKLFENWLFESLLLDGFLPDDFATTWQDWEFGWRWSEPQHVDRQKEADGQTAELANNTTTLAKEYARQGLDWETELRQRAREIALIKELGLTPAQAQPPKPQPANDQLDTAS